MKNIKHKIAYSFFIGTVALLACNVDSHKTGESPDSTIEKKESEHAHKDTSEVVVEELVITSKQFKAAGIELGKVEDAGLSETIKATGTLDVPPQNYAEVSAYIGGIIKSINVIEGDQVKSGQSIMTLEHPDFIRLQEDYTTIKSSIGYLEKEYLRQKVLSDQNVSSGKVFQEAESKYNSEKGRLVSIQSQLSMLGISTSELDKGSISKVISLRSPINGFIGHLNGSLGSYAEPNKMLFNVIDNSRINVHLDVYEKDFYKVKIGQRISVILPNQENAMVEGRISNIGKSMDNITKSISIHAEIINTDHSDLIPGVFVSALIYVGSNTVKAVPTEAVMRAGDKQYVFIVNKLLCEAPQVKGKDPYVVKDSKGNNIPLAYRMVEVTTGTEDKEQIEIKPLMEITSSDQLVVKGAYYLMSALKSGETVGCCAPPEEEKKE